ncbi:N-acetylmuramoyl-L-alanine amidase [Kitasatospora gansuensis]
MTVTNPSAPGFLTVYPYGTDRPLASNLNWVTGQTIPNQVIVPIKNGKISLYNGGGGDADFVVDVLGYQTW